MPFLNLKDEEIKGLSGLQSNGFVFDWTKKSSNRSQTTVFYSDSDIAGLVEFERRPEDLLNYLWLIEVGDNFKGTGVAGKLLAYVAKDSLTAGFDGFVLFEPKTYLYEFYIQAFKAKPVRDRYLMFDTETANWLIQKYLGTEEFA